MSQNDIFSYYPPKNKYIGILSIPHSGEEIPDDFHPYLSKNLKDLNCDVDYRVDALVDIDTLNKAGIAVIVSHIHRTCVDLNRSSDIAALAWKKNSKGAQLVIKEPEQEIKERMIRKYHVPYFEMIKTMINELHKETSHNISLVDLHSMPSEATEYHLKVTPDQPRFRPDFCVSDIEGLSCEESYIDMACNKLKVFSDDVNKNFPYYGGFITRHIHAQYKRINNIQIEISRALYMDEDKKELTLNKSDKLKENLTQSLVSFFKEVYR